MSWHQLEIREHQGPCLAALRPLACPLGFSLVKMLPTTAEAKNAPLESAISTRTHEVK